MTAGFIFLIRSFLRVSSLKFKFIFNLPSKFGISYDLLRFSLILVLSEGLCSMSILKSIIKFVTLPLLRFSSFVKFAVRKGLFVKSTRIIDFINACLNNFNLTFALQFNFENYLRFKFGWQFAYFLWFS